MSRCEEEDEDGEFKVLPLNRDKMLVRPCLVPPQIPKKCYSTYHIECLRPVHGALNVDEKN